MRLCTIVSTGLDPADPNQMSYATHLWRVWGIWCNNFYILRIRQNGCLQAHKLKIAQTLWGLAETTENLVRRLSAALESILPVFVESSEHPLTTAVASMLGDAGCDDLVPVHDILEERQFCKEQCQKIIDLCSKEAMLKGKTPLQCFADYVTENQPVGGKCTYTQKLVKGMPDGHQLM